MLRTAAMLVATLFSAGPRGWPTSYGEFETSIGPSDGAALKSESKSGFNSYIYLRSGYYVLK